jgi:hypothetical protein
MEEIFFHPSHEHPEGKFSPGQKLQQQAGFSFL